MATGRTREALRQVAPLAKASPLVPWIQAARADLLAANGDLEGADRAATDALSIWPRDPLIWFTSFDLAAFNGRPAQALSMAANRAGWPKRTRADDILLAARAVRAMISRDPGEASAVLAAYRSGESGQGRTERAMRVAAALGRADDALAFARELYEQDLRAEPRGTMLPWIGLSTDQERPTAALFMPPAQRLWSEPGFPILMSRIGLSDHWRRAGRPDLCRSSPGASGCGQLPR